MSTRIVPKNAFVSLKKPKEIIGSAENETMHVYFMLNIDSSQEEKLLKNMNFICYNNWFIVFQI